MRYVIAMVFAIAVAVLATIFVSPRIASFAVGQFTFTSPDEVGALDDGVFMASNVVALLAGWLIGWWAGGRLVKPVATPP